MSRLEPIDEIPDLYLVRTEAHKLHTRAADHWPLTPEICAILELHAVTELSYKSHETETYHGISELTCSSHARFFFIGSGMFNVAVFDPTTTPATTVALKFKDALRPVTGLIVPPGCYVALQNNLRASKCYTVFTHKRADVSRPISIRDPRWGDNTWDYEPMDPARAETTGESFLPTQADDRHLLTHAP